MYLHVNVFGKYSVFLEENWEAMLHLVIKVYLCQVLFGYENFFFYSILHLFSCKGHIFLHICSLQG